MFLNLNKRNHLFRVANLWETAFPNRWFSSMSLVIVKIVLWSEYHVTNVLFFCLLNNIFHIPTYKKNPYLWRLGNWATIQMVQTIQSTAKWMLCLQPLNLSFGMWWWCVVSFQSLSSSKSGQIFLKQIPQLSSHKIKNGPCTRLRIRL